MPRLPRKNRNINIDLKKLAEQQKSRSSSKDDINKKIQEIQKTYKILDDYHKEISEVFSDEELAEYVKRAVDEFDEVARIADEEASISGTSKGNNQGKTIGKVNIPRVNIPNPTIANNRRKLADTRVEKENTEVDTSAKKTDVKKATSVKKKEAKQEIDVYELLKDYARNNDAASSIDDFDIFIKATNRMSEIESILMSLQDEKQDASIVFFSIPLDELKSNAEASVITSKIESILSDIELTRNLNQEEKISGIQGVSRKIEELEGQVEQSTLIKQLRERTLDEGRKKGIVDLTKQALMRGVTAEDIKNAENQLESAAEKRKSEGERQ